MPQKNQTGPCFRCTPSSQPCCSRLLIRRIILYNYAQGHTQISTIFVALKVALFLWKRTDIFIRHTQESFLCGRLPIYHSRDHMENSASQKMPTGITSLDPILDGGVPQGSVILLLGDL